MQSPASTPDSTPSTRDGESPGSVTLQMKQHYALANQHTPPTPDVRLYHRAVVVAQDTPGERSEHHWRLCFGNKLSDKLKQTSVHANTVHC